MEVEIQKHTELINLTTSNACYKKSMQHFDFCAGFFLHWELINWKTKEFMQHLIFFKIVYFQPTTELTTESTGPPYLVKSPLESTNSSQRRH